MGDMITKIRALHRNRTLRVVRALPWTWEVMNLRDALRDALEDTRVIGMLSPHVTSLTRRFAEPLPSGPSIVAIA